MATDNPQVGGQNVQATLNNLGQNKKLVGIGAGVVTLILAIIIMFSVMSGSKDLGDQIELVKGIDQGRAFEIVSSLRAQDIDSKIIDGDTPGKVKVAVFEKNFDRAALALARSDLLQEDGYSLFDKTDWAASDYDKRVKMSRATNGDLSRIISRTTGIKWATVRINIPEQELFSQFESPTTATVQIETEVGHGKLNQGQVKSIINLLTGYVPNLKKENISVVDTSGTTYTAVEDEQVAAGEILAETDKINSSIQKRIEEYLSPLLGQKNFIVRVSSEISREKIERNATTFTEGAIGQEQSGDERVGGNSGRIAAIAAGPPSPNSVTESTDSDRSAYSKSNKIIQRYPSYEQKSTTTPPGTISNVKVAVAINRGVPPSVSVKQLQEGIAAIANPSTVPSDIKITIADFVGNATDTQVSKQNKSGLASNFSGEKTMENITTFLTSLPMWGKVVGGIIGIIIGLNILGAAFGGGQAQQSTLSQINQARKPTQQEVVENPRQIEAQQQAFRDRPIGELPEFKQQVTPQEKPDISKVLNGIQEAAVKKPEFVANRLQLWLEEGSAF